jgi:hypothetical protein
LKRVKYKKTSNKAAEDADNIIDYELGLNERKLVKQSYDNVLSHSEKVALEVVKDEEKGYKDKIEFLRRKKEREREERLERIKKMKLDND